jgi:hypothetical protein
MTPRDLSPHVCDPPVVSSGRRRQQRQDRIRVDARSAYINLVSCLQLGNTHTRPPASSAYLVSKYLNSSPSGVFSRKKGANTRLCPHTNGGDMM